MRGVRCEERGARGGERERAGAAHACAEKRQLRRPSLLNPRSSLLLKHLAVVLVLAASTVRADSPESIRARGEQLAAEVAAAAGDAGRETALVERLGEVVLAYVDESDRVQRAGEEERRAGALREAFEAVHAPLDGIYRRHADLLEKKARAVMAVDGDLEALYETAEFQRSQAAAAGALYHLNWLDYYGARVVAGERRAELLRACADGFSQFTVGEHASELVAESLLGRGLCHLELANYEWARRDFEAVIGGDAAPARKAKARLALLDAYHRGGDTARVVAYARELQNDDLVPAEDAPLVRFYELQALLDAADRATGAAGDGYRREAAALTARLRRDGGGWAAKVDALLASRVSDPSQWVGEADSPAAQWQLAQMFLQKEDCAGAEPLLEKLLAEGAALEPGRRREARYWRAVCHFRAGRHATAASELEVVLAADDTADLAADARYLRFKALEALMAVDDPPAELTSRYVAALRDLLQHQPDGGRGAEARYRLGEALQASGEYSAAIDQYEKVEVDDDLRLRAAFGALQCRFELLRDERDAAVRESLVAAVAADLARYDERAAALAKSGAPAARDLVELAARATLLRAVHASLAAQGGDERTAQILADFGERFPDQPELAAQAARMRLGALLRLARFDDAATEMANSAAVLRAEGRADALRGLASGYAADGRMSESPAAAAAAARVAVALHGLADDIGGAPPSPRQRVAIAQLQEKAGELDAAAAGYGAVLAESPTSLAALRGLARVAEAQGKPREALAHWATYTETVRGGDVGWFRGQYEQARLQLASGDRAAACQRLTALRTALAGLQDEELRAALKSLWNEADC